MSGLCLVTGAAGFIGSHLSRRLLAEGYSVRGVDCFTDYYDRRIKERNLADLLEHPRFSLIEQDLSYCTAALLEGVSLVFHQAAQAGVRASWGEEFAHYTHHNILATQRLLEAARLFNIRRFVFASSSSVYGEARSLPMREADRPQPISPYGVTKLAAEHLCHLYYRNFQVPVVSLRYFTVYGPGQRPDMAFHRFIRSIFQGRELTVYGSGNQTRDFTYIEDIVEANLAAARVPAAIGRVYNLGGGTRASINTVLDILKKLTGSRVKVRYQAAASGDPSHTFADTTRARQDLGFSPRFSLEEGLALEIADLKDLLNNRGL